jgi:hypothetical protein
MPGAHEFDVLVVVSPGGAGDERKDQDRAAWHPADRCAVVCDGTSSSLYAQTAAEQTARFAPVLFAGDLPERLAAWADYLKRCRLDACRRPPPIDAAVPAVVQAMLQDVVRAKAAQSFQTTCVAARFLPNGDVVDVDFLRVGDSAFLAFAADGTPRWPAGLKNQASPEQVLEGAAPEVNVVFGDRVLVRWSAAAWSHPRVSALIPAARRASWRVGEFVMACSGAKPRWRAHDTVHLAAGDLLVVPRYLTGALAHGSAGLWSCVTFSRVLRVVPAASVRVAESPFGARGVVTAVLPDDVATGRWQHSRAQFPRDTTFVLASDGLTRAFADTGAFWNWFCTHRERLARPAERAAVMEELHAHLRAHGGDDDIALVSIGPRPVAATGSRHQELEHD